MKDKKNVLDIDELNLDVEWLKHPKLARKYLDQLADARLVLDEEKAQLEVVKAELGQKIRKRPAKYKLEKPTDKPVEAVTILQPEYKDQLKKLHRAQHAVNMLAGMVSCIVDRRRALEHLVELHGQDYFAEPRTSKVGKGVLASVDERSRTRRANSKRKKRRDKDDDE